MAEKLKSVRGMNDLLPPDSAKWHYFENRCRELFSQYGYQEIRTPILESTDLFCRGIGEATDIVEKEMYSFQDLSHRPMTMRPEGTAACVRSFIQHSIHNKEPVTQWFYSGPMFRYERVQAGRYRQFYQIGVELYGVADATAEAEQISMLFDLYSGVGISNLTALINSVGTSDDRPRYRQALIDYATPWVEELCNNCKRRIHSNPMRMLDCKVQQCKTLLAEAPSVLDSLGEQSLVHFKEVQQTLDALGISYTVDPRLVRGLDYYTGTVFEIVAETQSLGNQSTIAAGGRYNGLVESLGGQPTPAVGFALGVERAIQSLPNDSETYRATPDVFIVSGGHAAALVKLMIAKELRQAGLYVALEHRDLSMKAQFKRANKLKSRFVITIGDDELKSDTVNLKNMDVRDERRIHRAGILSTLLTLCRPQRATTTTVSTPDIPPRPPQTS